MSYNKNNKQQKSFIPLNLYQKLILIIIRNRKCQGHQKNIVIKLKGTTVVFATHFRNIARNQQTSCERLKIKLIISVENN